MKKLVLILAAAAALAVSCQNVDSFKEIETPSVANGGYNFDFSVSGGGFTQDTKADATTGWTEGESVYIFFQPEGEDILDRYLTMTYDGSAFTASGSIQYGCLGEGGKLSAVYVPYLKSGVKPVYSEGSWTIDGGDVYYCCASDVSYTVNNADVSATIAMSIPDGYVQFAVPAALAADGDKMSCNLVDAYTCVTLGSDLAFSETPVRDNQMSGHKDGDKVYFWGKKNTVTAENCEFTIASSVIGANLEKSVDSSKVEKNKAYNLKFSDINYTFNLVNSSDAVQVFNNTSEDSDAQIIPINSKQSIEGGAETDAEWEIKSVKVGSADAVTVGADSFENIGGLSASISGSDLSLIASERISVSPGSHDYWTNKNGISGDTDGSGWSPKSWEDKGVIDLSKYNFQDETTNNAMNTANCYIIRHAGTYKLPLVYGNAVVNGAANEQSYYPNVTGGSMRLVRFQNHIQHDDLGTNPDKGIRSPFIENNTTDGLAKSADNSYLSAQFVEVVWQDMAEVVKNLKIVDAGGHEIGTGAYQTRTDGNYSPSDVHYLQFDIDPDTVCQNNAIVAVKDGAGTIMWSWHIWTTNDPTLLSNSISVTNSSDVEYKFFPLYNLGWVEATDYSARDDVKIVLVQKNSCYELEISVNQPEVLGQPTGCLYQWGRKDPIPAYDVTGFTAKDYSSTNGEVSLQEVICHPGSFYSGGNYDWSKNHYFNLWTGRHSDYGQRDQTENMIKTIYDPSPVGYKVPASKAFDGFSSANVEGPFNKGWNFYTKPDKQGDTIFFPAAGYRHHWGVMQDLGLWGEYWSALRNYMVSGLGLTFSADYIYNDLGNFNCCYAASVRPVIDPTMLDNMMK